VTGYSGRFLLDHFAHEELPALFAAGFLLPEFV
jgi:hypothetical protein